MKDLVEKEVWTKAEMEASLADIGPRNTPPAVSEKSECDTHQNNTVASENDEWEEFERRLSEPVDEDAQRAELKVARDEIRDDDLDAVPAISGRTGPGGPMVEDKNEEDAETSPALVLPAPVPASAHETSIPEGYDVFPDGLYERPADDSVDPIFICTPVRVEATFSDRFGKGWGRLVSVRSAAGQWHKIPVTSADLLRHSGDIVAAMVDHGLELSSDKRSKDRLVSFLKASKPNRHLQTVAQMGWVDSDYTSFALGSDLIGRKDVLPPALETGIGMGLSRRGSVEAWKTDIGEKCCGNPLMILAVSLAFTGPLLAPLGLSGGGLHFRGASSSGKTTLLNLAASVWGGRQLITQWRATSNGLEAIAATMNDMLLPLDEIAEISAGNLHEAIYMLANGTGKARMTKTATLADQARWRLALISSGEISVEEKLKEARLSVMAGHEVRLIDIEADGRLYGAFDILHGARDGAVFAESLQQAAQNHHGAVGQEFVRRLINYTKRGQSNNLGQLANKLVATWLPKLPSAPDGQISRVAKRFALIGLAGSLATKFDLTGWNEREVLLAAEHAFLDWYDRRYSTKRDAMVGYIKSLQDFLADHLGSLPETGRANVAVSDPLGWKDASRVFLTRESWATIFPEAEGTSAAKALHDMQMLIPGEEGRHMRKAPRSIPGRPRLYTLNIERVQTYRSE